MFLPNRREVILKAAPTILSIHLIVSNWKSLDWQASCEAGKQDNAHAFVLPTDKPDYIRSLCLRVAKNGLHIDYLWDDPDGFREERSVYPLTAEEQAGLARGIITHSLQGKNLDSKVVFFEPGRLVFARHSELHQVSYRCTCVTSRQVPNTHFSRQTVVELQHLRVAFLAEDLETGFTWVCPRRSPVWQSLYFPALEQAEWCERLLDQIGCETMVRTVEQAI